MNSGMKIDPQEELDRLLYVISHDLPEPLRKVRSFLQLVERELGPQEGDVAEFMGYVHDGAQRMDSMLQDLLAYSRIGRKESEFSVVPGAEMVAEAKRWLAGEIKSSGASIEVGPLPDIFCERPQAESVLVQLLDNALKFNREGEPPKINISGESDNQTTTIIIQDNGMGIAEDQLDRAFALFQTLNGRGVYPGNGFGLAFCRKVMARHEGSIRCESKTGSGSTFYVTFPLATQ